MGGANRSIPPRGDLKVFNSGATCSGTPEFHFCIIDVEFAEAERWPAGSRASHVGSSQLGGKRFVWLGTFPGFSNRRPRLSSQPAGGSIRSNSCHNRSNMRTREGRPRFSVAPEAMSRLPLTTSRSAADPRPPPGNRGNLWRSHLPTAASGCGGHGGIARAHAAAAPNSPGRELAPPALLRRALHGGRPAIALPRVESAAGMASARLPASETAGRVRRAIRAYGPHAARNQHGDPEPRGHSPDNGLSRAAQ